MWEMGISAVPEIKKIIFKIALKSILIVKVNIVLKIIYNGANIYKHFLLPLQYRLKPPC